MVKVTDDMRSEIDDLMRQHCSGDKVESKKLALVIRNCGLNPTEADLTDWKKTLGSDPKVDKLKSFVLEKLEKSADCEEQLVDAFQLFDKDGNGFIAVAEFKHIVTAMGEALTGKEMDEVMKELDVGSDGMINYKAFAEQVFEV